MRTATAKVFGFAVMLILSTRAYAQKAIPDPVDDATFEALHNEAISKAFTLSQSGDAAGAEKIFSGVIAGYKAKAIPGRTYFCADDLADTVAVATKSAKTMKPGSFAIVVGPNWCSALFGEGFVLIDLGRSDEAGRFLAQATEMAPTKPHYINEYAEWFKSQRNWQKSFELFSNAWGLVAHDAKGPDRKIAARALRGMGFIKTELGDFEEAERLFKQSLDYEPEKQPFVESELKYIADQRKKTY